jgi:hypothetical protein
VKISRFIPFENLYGELFQKQAHGGVDILIGACHDVASLLENSGQRGHSSSANPHEMDVPEPVGDGVEVRGKGSAWD